MTTLEQAIGHSQHHSSLNRLLNAQVFWVFLAAVLACVALSLMTDSFATQRNLFNVTRNFAFVGLIAIGMTTVIASGGIDLSVGSTVVLAAMVISVLMAAGNPFWLSALLALAAAAAVGLLNGALIAYVGMPPFVVTLGMLSAARSLAMVLSDNKMIWEFGPDHDVLLWLGGGSTLGLPHPIYALGLLTIVMSVVFRWTRWGQYVFAIGGNEQAATLTGIPVKRIKVSIYMFSALTAGVAGILMAGWLGSVTTNLGQAMELTVIAAAVIGGANLAGGEGTALGAVIGALLIEVIRNSLILLGISTFWQGMFIGSFIIIAVAFDRIRNLRTLD
ncbi:ABC transporter permease [Roseibium salinum]|uniref:ABC transporter permease n=1 Tax=Roseibium salinum TaxID=1604349 RepID=A0ABT3QWZ9_9HYPH|nr:ABC transporter permease [Roseibium sp. DSM 29163]MCX2721361.1 ABC transporter permease [Roseibium sp. DSM 29163]MDN3722243.1 ABC transporter permease [Roseibium salinum]